MPSTVQIRLAIHAMATRFEFVLEGNSPSRLRAAGEEALEEIARIEGLLSAHRAGTDISRINARAIIEPVSIQWETFRLLERAVALAKATVGAFDPTVGPLVRFWRELRDSGSTPSIDSWRKIRTSVGVDGLELDVSRLSVQFHKSGMALDLGSIGKGYALDRASELLRDAGIPAGLIHGGTSSVVAWGSPDRSPAWRISLPKAPIQTTPLGVDLVDESLSLSATWGGRPRPDISAWSHVIDPRTGETLVDDRWAAVTARSAADSDALSTALLVSGEAVDWIGQYLALRWWRGAL